jgi:DNA end-binding protein Ku
MSPRPYWKGYLKLSLVSCPIAVHAACSSQERVSFRQINRNTGNRLRQQLVDEETRDQVEGSAKARGSLALHSASKNFCLSDTF